MDDDVIERYHAIETPVKYRSGCMADVDFDGILMRVTSNTCEHPTVEVALYYTGREAQNDLSAVVYCPVCGYRESVACALLTPAQTRIVNARTREIFGEVDRRFERYQRFTQHRKRGQLCT